MCANGAHLGSRLTDHQVTAFAALPHHFFALFEDLLHLNVVEKLQEAFFMRLFDGSDGTELCREFGKAFGFAVFAKPSYISVHS